jgi:hypothetical protein
MATYHERNESRNKGVDAYNQRTASREFYADIREPSAAVALVVATEGGISSQYPGDGGLIVDNITTSAAPDGIGTYVQYAYSTDRRFTSPTTVDKDKMGYYTWSSSWTTTTIKIPAARRVKRVVASGNTTTLVDIWENIEGDSLPQPAQVVTINVTVPFWGPDESAVIDAHAGALHKPNGANSEWYLFEGATVSRRGDGIYDVTYTYRGDTTTYPPPEPLPSDFTRPEFPRTPWTDYYMIPSIDPIFFKPTFGLVSRMIPKDENGHLSLPGWPL